MARGMIGMEQIAEALGIMSVIVIMLGCGLAIVVNRMRADASGTPGDE